MNGLASSLGKMVYWLVWPLRYIALNNSRRTRVIISCRDEVLVVTDVIGDGKWSLPGGGIKKGESVQKCAVREVSEETGLEIEAPELIAEFDSNSQLAKVKIYILHKNLKDKLEISNKRPLEIAKVAWLRLEDIDLNNASSNTLKALDLWKNSK